MFLRSAARLTTTTSRKDLLKSALSSAKYFTPIFLATRTMATHRTTLLEAVAEDHQEVSLSASPYKSDVKRV